jgi:opacity protein-like surface antigen
MRRIQVVSCATLLLAVMASASHAVVRRTPAPLLWQRTAVSGYLGKGLPVGEFSDSREGFGNQKEGAIDWAVEIEHFVGHTTSLGFSYANTEYEDKDLGDALKTKVETASGFIRVVIPTATSIRPYLRFGLGGVQVEFLDPVSREDSEWEFSLQAGGGLLWLPSRWLGLSAQALYYHGDTDDSPVFVADNGDLVVVGFNTEYWAFSAGVSLFFP